MKVREKNMFKKVLFKSSVILGVLSMPMMAESLKGRVFEDTNKNGIYDKDTDLRLKDVNVTVTDAQGTIVTVKTNVNGVYKVKGISIGEALITINESTLPGINPVQVVGVNPSTKNVRAGKANWSGKDGYTFDQLTGSVCGDAYLDGKSVAYPAHPYVIYPTNNVFNKGEGMINKLVTIIDVNGNEHNTSTNSNGRYCISGIPVGEATITIEGDNEKSIWSRSSQIDVVHVNKINEAPISAFVWTPA